MEEKSYRLLLSIFRQSKQASKMCEMREKPLGFDGNTECCWWFCLVPSKGYVRPKYVTVQYIRVVVFILLHHVHGIEERIMNLWLKSYREEVLFMVLQSWTR